MKGLIVALIFSSHFLFSQNNIAIFHANKSTVSASTAAGKAVSIAPFQLVNGMVVVKADINGETGNFILDTGSPGLVINTKSHLNSSEYTGSSVGGELAIGEVIVDQFKWGIIEKTNIKGFSIDISHLTNAAGQEIAGLIGFEILQQYEILFDYPNEMVKIYGPENCEQFRNPSPMITVSFEMNGHIPVIPIKAGNKKVYLGLDSGAEVNLIDQSYFKTLNKSFLSRKTKEKVVGLDQKEHDVVRAIVNSSVMNGHMLPAMKFLFMDLNFLSEQLEKRFDGLLGFPFFQQHAVAINYNERKIYIWN